MNNVQSFTPRMEEILLRRVRGVSIKAIAEELVLSPHTVKTHQYRMFRFLGVDNIRDAMRVAVQRGYLKDFTRCPHCGSITKMRNGSENKNVG